MSSSRSVRWGVLAGVLLPALLFAACTSSPTASGHHSSRNGGTSPASGHSKAPPQQHDLVISPANGRTSADPSRGITVTMAHGSIEHIAVRSASGPVPGSFSAGHTAWHSRWALGVSARYTVTATALDSTGRQVRATSTFVTLSPSQTFATQIFEGYRTWYGVGMPIILNFNRPITNEAAVERSLEITTSRHVVGAWYWNGDEQVVFRPRAYWPAGTRVSFVGHFDGVEGAPGVYGFHTLTQTFFIGQSVIVVAGTQTHYMDVYVGGKLRYHWPISTGRSTLPTPDGTYLTLDKRNPQHMVGPGYNLEVPWSVRFTLSGDFLHAAPWSVSAQGFVNVSHGCVNMPPADAEIFYKMDHYGDPVTITGSPLAGKWNDGWTEWFLSWDELVAGSALHEAVVAGPHGSSFVHPAALLTFDGSAPVQQPAPHNAAAA